MKHIVREEQIKLIQEKKKHHSIRCFLFTNTTLPHISLNGEGSYTMCFAQHTRVLTPLRLFFPLHFICLNGREAIEGEKELPTQCLK